MINEIISEMPDERFDELIDAIRSKDIEKIRTLVKAIQDAGINIDTPLYQEEWTAFIFAAVEGNQESMQVLLDAGANVDAKDKDGWSALHYLAEHEYSDRVEFLLSKKANIHAVTNDLITVLDCTIPQQKDSKEGDSEEEDGTEVDSKEEDGTEVDGTDDNSIAASTTNMKAFDLPAIQDKEEDNDSKDKREDNFIAVMIYMRDLMYACARGHSKRSVDTLIEEEKNNGTIDKADTTGWTALHYAVQYAVRSGDWTNVQSLINAGADVNKKDNNGMTALIGAVESGNIEMVEVLLRAPGADVNVVANNGMTAFAYAILNRNFEIAKLLESAGAECYIPMGHPSSKDLEGNFSMYQGYKIPRESVTFNLFLFDAFGKGKESISK